MLRRRVPRPGYPALIPLLLVPLLAAAQPSGGSYTMRKQVIGAGAESSAGPYRLNGTIAEPAAGTLVAANLRLTGGFHGAFVGAAGSDRIFCNGFEATVCN